MPRDLVYQVGGQVGGGPTEETADLNVPVSGDGAAAAVGGGVVATAKEVVATMVERVTPGTGKGGGPPGADRGEPGAAATRPRAWAGEVHAEVRLDADRSLRITSS
jgi:hypothetical protein